MSYTPNEKRLIRRRYGELTSGKCICLSLLLEKNWGRITEEDYNDVMCLRRRCPLYTNGSCPDASTGPGKIDMFDAVREINLIGD